MPSDRQRLVLTVLFSGWAMAFGFSLVVCDAGASERFWGWQMIAGLLAYAVFVVSRGWPKGAAVRQVAWVPPLAGLLVAALALAPRIIGV